MIEDAIGYILGVCVGCILFLIYEVFNLYKKIERINIDINKLQNKDIEFHRNMNLLLMIVNIIKKFLNILLINLMIVLSES